MPHGSPPSKILSSSLGRDVFGAIPSHLCPLLRCVLAVIRGETVLEHVGLQFRACLNTALKHWYSAWCTQRLCSWAASATEFNIGGIKFGDFLLDHQIAKLKTLPNLPTIQYYASVLSQHIESTNSVISTECCILYLVPHFQRVGGGYWEQLAAEEVVP